MKGHVAKRRWKTKSGIKTGWYVVIDFGRDLDGKRRQKWHGGFATRAEAESGRAALIAEFDAGTYTEPSAVTLEYGVGLGLVVRRELHIGHVWDWDDAALATWPVALWPTVDWVPSHV